MMKILTFGIAVGALGAALACSSQANEPAQPQVAAQPSAPSAAVLDHGRGLYKAHCAPCHGETGRGDGPAAGVLKPGPRDHTDRGYMSALTDEELAKVIKMGGAPKGKPLMPGNPQFKGADLDALVAFTRSLSTTTTP